MEVGVKVLDRKLSPQHALPCKLCYFTFVAVDREGRLSRCSVVPGNPRKSTATEARAAAAKTA